MKRMIRSSKQVGKVYYMVSSLESLYMILKQGQIKVSSKKEKPVGSDISEYFVSLTRNYKSLYHQNPDRWHCGIILDGDSLSDTYSISPIHYAGHSSETIDLDARSGQFKPKQITAWEDGTYDILFVGWKHTFDISKSCYEDLVNVIDSLDESIKHKCR